MLARAMIFSLEKYSNYLCVFFSPTDLVILHYIRHCFA